MSNNDREVFAGKSFSELLEEIHKETNERTSTIKLAIDDLLKHIKDVNSASVLAPTIGRYMETWVHSDEHKLKLAMVIQRIISAESYKGGTGSSIEAMLSDSEKEALLMAAKALGKELEAVEQEKAQVIASLPVTGSNP